MTFPARLTELLEKAKGLKVHKGFANEITANDTGQAYFIRHICKSDNGEILAWAKNHSELIVYLVNHAEAIRDLVVAAEKVKKWNNKYPSSRIYDESSIRRIAAEMDAINYELSEALAKLEEA